MLQIASDIFRAGRSVCIIKDIAVHFLDAVRTYVALMPPNMRKMLTKNLSILHCARPVKFLCALHVGGSCGNMIVRLFIETEERFQ